MTSSPTSKESFSIEDDPVVKLDPKHLILRHSKAFKDNETRQKSFGYKVKKLIKSPASRIGAKSGKTKDYDLSEWNEVKYKGVCFSLSISITSGIKCVILKATVENQHEFDGPICATTWTRTTDGQMSMKKVDYLDRAKLRINSALKSGTCFIMPEHLEFYVYCHIGSADEPAHPKISQIEFDAIGSNQCLKCMAQKLSVDNVFDFLTAAYNAESNKYKKLSLQFAVQNFQQIKVKHDLTALEPRISADLMIQLAQ